MLYWDLCVFFLSNLRSPPAFDQKSTFGIFVASVQFVNFQIYQIWGHLQRLIDVQKSLLRMISGKNGRGKCCCTPKNARARQVTDDSASVIFCRMSEKRLSQTPTDVRKSRLRMISGKNGQGKCCCTPKNARARQVTCYSAPVNFCQISKSDQIWGHLQRLIDVRKSRLRMISGKNGRGKCCCTPKNARAHQVTGYLASVIFCRMSEKRPSRIWTDVRKCRLRIIPGKNGRGNCCCTPKNERARQGTGYSAPVNFCQISKSDQIWGHLQRLIDVRKSRLRMISGKNGRGKCCCTPKNARAHQVTGYLASVIFCRMSEKRPSRIWTDVQLFRLRMISGKSCGEFVFVCPVPTRTPSCGWFGFRKFL